MKWLWLLIFVPLFELHAQMNCPAGQIRAYVAGRGSFCVNQFPSVAKDCYICQQQYLLQQQQQQQMNWFAAFPPALYQPKPQPWWATQGNLYYPNLHYPGAWNYPHISAQYYPGSGEVFAAKPNVYVESIYQDKKFSFGFPGEKLSFLATTPALDEKNVWKGRVWKDKFEVDGINYDYLFYDIRLPKEKMQFERGVCATREDAIQLMLKDLTEMNYPAIALQDFEVHWKVKIPDYPFYCIYPQYTDQLNATLPVTISLAQTQFLRTLFVLVPHKEQPDAAYPQEIPFPTLDPTEIRPKSIIRYENNFREWGVAFLGQ